MGQSGGFQPTLQMRPNFDATLIMPNSEEPYSSQEGILTASLSDEGLRDISVKPVRNSDDLLDLFGESKEQ
jgi:hypothetical protein